ncbi:MAG: TRAP transporter substrate-binding protein [Deltaproteobacteria bacterium]|nr:TRAP transporter substrate-binding protein [Deltaproteobacteria bacterium]
MKKFLIIPMVIALMMSFCLVGTVSHSVAAEKTWVLKYHHEMPATGSYHRYGHKPWADAVEKATKGRVKIQIYPLQTLVKAKDAWNAVRSGLADIAWSFTAHQPGRFDLFTSLELPFMVTSAEAAAKTAWALYEKYPELQGLFTDIKLLSTWTTASYSIVSKKRLNKLEDLKGLKIRSAGPWQTNLMKLYGASPMYIPMPDVYINFQKGVLDAVAAPADAYVSFKFYEVGQYINQVNLPAGLHFLVMNKKRWNEFPPDIQKAIASVSGAYAGVHFLGGGTFDRAEREAPAAIKKAGYDVTFYKPSKTEMDRFIEVGGKPLWNKWLNANKSKGPAQAIFDDTKRLMKMYTK